jgi:hypothetical protein
MMNAKVVKQPGDGSCLYYSLAHSLPTSVSAIALRKKIAAWVADNPDEIIADSPLKDWASFADIPNFLERSKCF